MYKDGNKKTFTEFNAEIAEKNNNVGKKERKIEARCCDLRFQIYDLKTHETDEKYTIVCNNIVYHRMLFDGVPGSGRLNLNNTNKETD